MDTTASLDMARHPRPVDEPVAGVWNWSSWRISEFGRGPDPEGTTDDPGLPVLRCGIAQLVEQVDHLKVQGQTVIVDCSHLVGAGKVNGQHAIERLVLLDVMRDTVDILVVT